MGRRMAPSANVLLSLVAPGLLNLQPLVGAASGAAAADDPVLLKLQALEAEFKSFKKDTDALVGRALAESAGERYAMEGRIEQLEAEERSAGAARRLHSGSSLQGLTWSVGNNTEVSAKNAKDIKDLQSAMDHTWLILCGSLVMFMQAGFAMVESGCCRAKNVQNILMKNLVDVCMGTLCWWGVGWTLAYGIADGENHAFANSNQAFGMGMTPVTSDGIFTPSDSNYMLNWFFQWAFCSAAATIVSGGVAERVNFPGYLVFTLVMTSFIYPVVVHWTWGYGWLSGGDDYQINKTGFMDFAGSGIVHMCGGVGALVGAITVGPRKGRFDDSGESFHPHSLPLIVLGTFILWFGWYGFNCGSTLGMQTKAQGTIAAQVAMNTTLSAATCGLCVLFIRYVFLKKYDIGGMCNGVLAGLVSITAGCATVECGSAVLIGLIGAVFYQSVSSLLQRLKIDDPIDAFAVHGSCGMWGVLAAALFDWGSGVDYFNGWSTWSCVGGAGSCRSGAWGEAMVANILEIVVICSWTASLSALIFVPLRLAGVLRAPDGTQDAGMDPTKHSPAKAYTVG